MNASCLSPEGVAMIGCLESLFGRLISLAASFAGILFLIMLLIGGFRYLFSGGDAKKTEGATGTLTAAILGLVLVVSAYLILLLISNFTGLPDLLKFQIPNF